VYEHEDVLVEMRGEEAESRDTGVGRGMASSKEGVEADRTRTTEGSIGEGTSSSGGEEVDVAEASLNRSMVR
jgi:hypothetical protein